jgi:hypothetical protein
MAQQTATKQLNTSPNITNGGTAGNGVFYVVRTDSYVMQQYKNCWKRYFLLGLSRGCITRTNGRTSQSREFESSESAVSSWGPDPPEVAADGPPWWRRGRQRSPYCCKPLRSNAELVVIQSPANKDVNTEAEEVTALEAVTTQPVKTWQTEET